MSPFTVLFLDDDNADDIELHILYVVTIFGREFFCHAE
jgi:hypothetical protein